MRHFFIGFLFVFLDFNLDIELVRIGLIPDFVGYYFLLKGLGELLECSDYFRRAVPLAKGMLIASIFLYALDVCGFWVWGGGIFSYLIGLVLMTVSLMISHHIVRGVYDLQVLEMRDLRAEHLYHVWKIYAVLVVSVQLLGIGVQFFAALALFLILLSLVAAICFLVVFNRSKKLYYGR